ncbi:MAG: hypothetical protein MHM6MM_009383, partial [Cercozoa sp. M6MM]
ECLREQQWPNHGALRREINDAVAANEPLLGIKDALCDSDSESARSDESERSGSESDRSESESERSERSGILDRAEQAVLAATLRFSCAFDDLEWLQQWQAAPQLLRLLQAKRRLNVRLRLHPRTPRCLRRLVDAVFGNFTSVVLKSWKDDEEDEDMAPVDNNNNNSNSNEEEEEIRVVNNNNENNNENNNNENNNNNTDSLSPVVGESEEDEYKEQQDRKEQESPG